MQKNNNIFQNWYAVTKTSYESIDTTNDIPDTENTQLHKLSKIVFGDNNSSVTFELDWLKRLDVEDTTDRNNDNVIDEKKLKTPTPDMVEHTLKKVKEQVSTAARNKKVINDNPRNKQQSSLENM